MDILSQSSEAIIRFFMTDCNCFVIDLKYLSTSPHRVTIRVKCDRPVKWGPTSALHASKPRRDAIHGVRITAPSFCRGDALIARVIRPTTDTINGASTTGSCGTPPYGRHSWRPRLRPAYTQRVAGRGSNASPGLRQRVRLAVSRLSFYLRSSQDPFPIGPLAEGAGCEADWGSCPDAKVWRPYGPASLHIRAAAGSGRRVLRIARPRSGRRRMPIRQVCAVPHRRDTIIGVRVFASSPMGDKVAILRPVGTPCSVASDARRYDGRFSPYRRPSVAIPAVGTPFMASASPPRRSPLKNNANVLVRVPAMW